MKNSVPIFPTDLVAFIDGPDTERDKERDESISRINPEAKRHKSKTALARLAWESGYDSAVLVLARRRVKATKTVEPINGHPALFPEAV